MRALLLVPLVAVLMAASLPLGRKGAKARAATAVGQPFPAFGGITISEAHWDNAIFKDKVTLVSLWRIGCTWCMLEIPYYDALLDSVNDPRFQIISLAPQTRDELAAYYSTGQDSPVAKARDAMHWMIPRYDVLPMCATKRIKKAGELGIQCSALEELFGADGYPVTLVVGPDGVIRHRHEGLPVDAPTMQPKLDDFRNELDSPLRVL